MKKVVNIYFMNEEERKKRYTYSDGFIYLLEDGTEVYTMTTDVIAHNVIPPTNAPAKEE